MGQPRACRCNEEAGGLLSSPPGFAWLGSCSLESTLPVCESSWPAKRTGLANADLRSFPREAAAGHGCALFPARARLRGPGACGRPRGRRRGGTLDRRARRCRACDLAGLARAPRFQVSRNTAYPLRVAEAEDTKSLWRQFSTNKDDKALRDRLILTYAPLVKYVAGRLGSGLPAHVDEGDLVSYGLLGLIGAIERYDPERDVKFETYAIARIKGSIIDELRAMDWVPRSVRARARDIERAIGELEAKLGIAPTDEQIAAKIGITVEELEESLGEIARSSIAALDELWTVSGSGGAQGGLTP